MSSWVPEVRPLSRADIERQAFAVLQRFYPKLLREPGWFPVIDFFDILRDAYGLDPGVEELSDGVEGVTWPDGRVILSEETYRAASQGNGRARFTVPHEGYHGIQHRGQIRRALVHTGGLVLHRRQSIPAYKDPEWQANVFAAAVLMPALMVKAVVANVFDPVGAIVRTFGVSRTAAEVRISQLRL